MTGKSTLRRALFTGAAATTAMVVFLPQAAQAGGMDLIEVRPYERVVINDRFVMGLLPEGEQNYVVTSPEYYDEEIEAAKSYPGSSIRPNSVGAGVYGEDGEIVLIEGVWRLDEGVPFIAVAPEGDELSYGAQPVALRHEDGWGTFYFDPAAWEIEGTDTYTIIATDADGDVFSEFEVSLDG
ncbi:hypothetical protein [Streptomyces hoynatensis]|uniref:Tat pathway signal sequence domain protein n=1 Tax=Streptomyces hoynatensis TaxID=1141874 RepID=A0A3A9YTA9_9ACTN|nr:hypothetical protein [Streptomyces hoynatensis]RKN38506.1 hypothetical protein D7294_23810 [Streptomyces hoynatensis]